MIKLSFKFLKQFINRFINDPFKTIDNINLQYYGFQFNILRNDKKLCKVLLELVVIIPLIFWVLLGPDSTAEQLAYLIFNFPAFLTGSITFHQLIDIYNSYYGLGTHWSAAVIYGLLFIGLSKYFRDKLEIKNSENLSLTTGFVGLAIGSFEFFWMSSYYFFQGQTWILTLQWPQLRIILQNILFLLPGLIIIFGMNHKEYKLNFNKKTLLYLLITISLVFLWWHYPFPVQQLTIEIEGYGTWTSSTNFCQTMYTIDLNVLDNVAVGEMFHVEDSAVHLLNNVCKIFWTLTFYKLSKIKKH